MKTLTESDTRLRGKSYGQLTRLGSACLAGTSPTPHLDAQTLLSFCSGKDLIFLLAHGDRQVESNVRENYSRLLDRRRAGEPVAYLTGTRGFWSLDLRITREVLIPRPETELLVELALERLMPIPKPKILDLGTGSGAIALALASELPAADIVATDISLAALKLAQSNASRFALSNIRFVVGDWFQALAARRFDLIVANPPYLQLSDRHLHQGDLRYEPRDALVAGSSGMLALEAISAGAKDYLKQDAVIILEHGFNQREMLFDMLSRIGYQHIQCHDDLSGLPRAIVAGCPKIL